MTEVSQLLKDEVDFTLISKRSRSLPHSEFQNGIMHVRPPAKTYLKDTIIWMRNHLPHMIQVENRPLRVQKLKRRFPQIPIWLSLHSVRFISQPALSPSTVRRCLKLADEVIVNSHFLKDFVKGIAPEIAARIHVIYPGVRHERFISRWTPLGKQLRLVDLQELGYENKKIVLYAGRLLDIKGVHHLLKALPAVISEHPDVVLLIVGSAYYGKNTLTPYVKKLHQLGGRYPQHVRFVPFVPHDQMTKWFRMADVVVVPSSEQEAFGLVNIEAMACGVPVIATRAGGMKEIIRHQQNGVLIDQEAMASQLPMAINQLLHDQRLAQQMGQQGADDVANRFTWGHTADNYRKLLDTRLPH